MRYIGLFAFMMGIYQLADAEDAFEELQTGNGEELSEEELMGKILCSSKQIIKKGSDICDLFGEVVPSFYQKDINPNSPSYNQYAGPQNYRGNVVVLNFWTTTCAPCLREFPDLNNINALDGIVVLAYKADDKEESEPFKNVLSNVSFPVLGLEGIVPTTFQASDGTQYQNGNSYDSLGVHLQESLFHVNMYPTTLIINKEGIVQNILAGQLSERRVLDLIGELK